MKSFVFLASLLTGAMSLSCLTAGDRSRPSKSDDLEKENQLREEKTERPLAGLADRCQKMLDMQIAVCEGTKSLHKVIQGIPAKKPRPEDQQASLRLAADERDIVNEATKSIDILEAEEVAVAFPEVLQELRKDMERLQRRLKSNDVGTDTQAIEQDIIDTLKEMIAALKKR